MEDDKKRRAMIAVIVICALVTGIIYWWTNGFGSAESSGEGFENDTVLMKCNNPKCQAEYEITGKEYHEFMEQANPEGLMGMQCKQCGKRSVFKAVRCEKCGSIFFYGVGGTDFKDRCPKCGFSKTESTIKKVAD